MILYDVCLYGLADRKHIHINGPVIQRICSNRDELDKLPAEIRLELNGATVLPGFINSHDHLDFNSYPQLGNRIYANYTEWGKDIHAINASVINAVQKIPQALQIQWGLYKNLLNGFTTVVNHGKKLPVNDELVNVFQDCYPLHSPAFEKHWSAKLNYPFRYKKPFVMHIGEGTGAAAHAEVDAVRKRNYFNRKIMAIHGVAMDAVQAPDFEGLVWCPASNYFLLGKTAAIDQLKQKTNIVFGTDSTLTSSWHVAKHFAAALNSGMVNETELLGMLTTAPARLWRMDDRGLIKEGMRADILIMRPGHSIFSNMPEEMQLIINGGEIRIMSAKIFSAVQSEIKTGLDKISIAGSIFFVKPGIIKLANEIRSFYPDAYMPFESLDENK
jgi:cytosine/adenosine deaminase-related metal-dependent hydrolase